MDACPHGPLIKVERSGAEESRLGECFGFIYLFFSPVFTGEEGEWNSPWCQTNSTVGAGVAVI